MPTTVSDFKSNKNDQIKHAAEVIGKSDARRQVFKAVYHGKRKVKTVDEIAMATGLDRKQVLTAGKKLALNHVIGQTKVDGDTAYEKDDSYGAHKATILSLAGSAKKLAALPTKTHPKTRVVQTVNVKVATKAFDVRRVTIDDIAPKVASVKARSVTHAKMSETDFKSGFQIIVDEPRKFKDWGGERNDVFTTQMKIKSTRRATAIAFKGPGQKSPLTPSKLGKNGDQIQRLFDTGAADVFIQQFWADVDQSVHDLMYTHALAESVKRGGKTVWCCVIDGTDSARLIKAYPDAFPKERKK